MFYFLKRVRTSATLVFAVGMIASARAGSIIDTNLPSGTEIVNIDGTTDGHHAGDEQNFQQPFFSGNPTELTLGPGTYSFDLVNRTDAANRFSALTSAQLNTIQGAWTYNSPWVTDYLAFDSSALTDPTQSQLFAGAITRQVAGIAGWDGGYQATGGYATADEAYQSAVAGGYANQIVVNPGGRYNGTTTTTYTITQSQTLLFVVPDYYLPDNQGGVSIVVQNVAAPVPEPGSFLALGVGAFGLIGRRKRLFVGLGFGN